MFLLNCHEARQTGRPHKLSFYTARREVKGFSGDPPIWRQHGPERPECSARHHTVLEREKAGLNPEIAAPESLPLGPVAYFRNSQASRRS